MAYNWQLPNWPDFIYNLKDAEGLILDFTREAGYMSGLLQDIPENIKTENLLDIMVAEAIKTSEIEGEFISREDVVSSIRNNLGLNQNRQIVNDKRALGLGELMTDSRKTFPDSLTEEKLCLWHIMLLGRNEKIKSGMWRKGNAPMQVVSGTIGKEKIHFEAPPSHQLPEEMRKFIQWFNDTAPGGQKEMKIAPVRSAIAHLYFESIHPFEDGNGRIGRVIAEKALAQTLGHPVMLSLSKIIEAKKKLYYQALENAQRNNNITDWIYYFVQTVLEAQIDAKHLFDFTLKKTSFFDQYKTLFNDRQFRIISKMLDAGPDGFQGGMTAKKYMTITKTSKATATRDLQNLLEIYALKQAGGGRNIQYTLNI